MRTIQMVGVIGMMMMLGCTKGKFSSMDLNTNERIYWVDSSLQDCMGVAPMSCLSVQNGEKVVEGNWTLFYNEIEGFQFEPGYVYKLLVKEEKLPVEMVPADASAFHYTLVKVLEKKRAK